MSNNTNPSNEGSLYENNPDTGKIDVVFTAVLEKDPELDKEGTSSETSGTAGENTMVTETEIGIISTNDIQRNGCVVLSALPCNEQIKKTIKDRAEASKKEKDEKGIDDK